MINIWFEIKIKRIICVYDKCINTLCKCSSYSYLYIYGETDADIGAYVTAYIFKEKYCRKNDQVFQSNWSLTWEKDHVIIVINCQTR